MIERRLKPLRLGEHIVKKPIVGGAMSIAVAGSELVAAGANIGIASTLGGVGRAFLPENRGLADNFRERDCMALQRLIDVTREKSPDGAVGVNILMAARWHRDLIRAAVESGGKGQRSKINYLVVGAGFDEKVPEWTQDHPEVALLFMASADLAASLMARAWWKDGNGRKPDGIIMEAPKFAGGHLGASRDKIDRRTLTLEHSIPELRTRLIKNGLGDVPIIAAGGIWNQVDMEKIMALGANGIQMATRFVTTRECDAPDAFKQMYLTASQVEEGREEHVEGDIVLVDSPVGLPGRAIYNKFLKQLERGEINDRCKVNCLTKCACHESQGRVSFCIIDRLVKAVEGDVENGLVFCGSNAYRSKEQGIATVKQVVDELCGVDRI